MAETLEHSASLSAAEQEDSNTEPDKEETSLSEELQKNLDINQDVDSSGCSVSAETDVGEKPEQNEGPTVCSPAAEASSESKTLKPEADLQTQKLDCQDWRPGSRCRAVYSGDGLVYPAVILWVKGQRCCVRYDDYNNEEEQDVGSLLKINEFIGPNRLTSVKGGDRRTTVERERGTERRSAWRDDHFSSSGRERGYQGKTEREEKKKDGDKATNHSLPFFPSFPPPFQTNSGDSQSFLPPPPPPPPPFSWAGGGKESVTADSASSMLMLWYMCGFHTGSYLAHQAFRSGSKE